MHNRSTNAALVQQLAAYYDSERRMIRSSKYHWSFIMQATSPCFHKPGDNLFPKEMARLKRPTFPTFSPPVVQRGNYVMVEQSDNVLLCGKCLGLHSFFIASPHRTGCYKMLAWMPVSSLHCLKHSRVPSFYTFSQHQLLPSACLPQSRPTQLR